MPSMFTSHAQSAVYMTSGLTALQVGQMGSRNQGAPLWSLMTLHCIAVMWCQCMHVSLLLLLCCTL